MKTLKLKLSPGGVLSLQNPQAKTGEGKRVSTVEVVNIPDDVPAAKVISIVNRCAWLSLPRAIDFSAIKPGIILK